MTDLHKAAQQALEALEDLRVWRAKQSMAVIALRAALAQQTEPAQRSQDWHDGVLEGQLREREHWLAQQAEPVQEPLPLTDLQAALVLTNLIDRDAIDNPDEYDEGSTLAQVDELYRIIRAAAAIRARSKE